MVSERVDLTVFKGEVRVEMFSLFSDVTVKGVKIMVIVDIPGF